MPLQRVNADVLTPPAAIGTLRGFRPFFLPDGRHFGFHNNRVPGAIGIHVADLESAEAVLVRATGREAKYADGHLVFVENEHLVAAPFDPVRRQLTGEPIPLAEFISHNGETSVDFSVAGRLLAFRDIPLRTRQLVWRGRDGRRLDIVEGDGHWRNPELSPDNTRLAVERNEGKGTNLDIWVLDVIGGNGRAVAAQREGERAPFWSVEGNRVFYLPDLGSQMLLSVSPGGGPATPLAESAGAMGFIHGLSADGKRLIGFRLSPAGNRDIVLRPIDSPDHAVTFAESAFNETQPSLSRDGEWMAYVSDELGLNNTTDVFIQAFPGGGQKVHVTAGAIGGLQPRWQRDGRELYYLGRDRRLMVVAVERAGSTLRVGTPRPLFEVAADLESGLGTRAIYDVTRDGLRFIVAEDRDGPPVGAVPITVLVDWRSKVTAGRQ